MASSSTSDTTTPQPSFRAQYARRLIREKIYRELVKRHGLQRDVPYIPGDFLEGPDEHVPSGPYDLPRDVSDGSLRAPDRRSFKFCIIGAGAAGLFLAMILSEAHIPYDLLEASDRVGGRMYTKEFSKRIHDYYDIGAMRYPDIPPMKK